MWINVRICKLLDLVYEKLVIPFVWTVTICFSGYFYFMWNNWILWMECLLAAGFTCETVDISCGSVWIFVCLLLSLCLPLSWSVCCCMCLWLSVSLLLPLCVYYCSFKFNSVFTFEIMDLHSLIGCCCLCLWDSWL